jgi:hypothetical protein
VAARLLSPLFFTQVGEFQASGNQVRTAGIRRNGEHNGSNRASNELIS